MDKAAYTSGECAFCGRIWTSCKCRQRMLIACVTSCGPVMLALPLLQAWKLMCWSKQGRMQLARKSQMPLHYSLFGREDLERDPRQRSGRRSRRPVGVWQEVDTIMLRMSMLQDLPQNDVLANKINKAIEVFQTGLPKTVYTFPRWFCWDSATMLTRKTYVFEVFQSRSPRLLNIGDVGFIAAEQDFCAIFLVLSGQRIESTCAPRLHKQRCTVSRSKNATSLTVSRTPRNLLFGGSACLSSQSTGLTGTAQHLLHRLLWGSAVPRLQICVLFEYIYISESKTLGL